MGLMLKNQDGNPSTSRTIFFYGCLICILKLALSKMDLGFIKVPEFGGGDFGMAIAALGSMNSLNKHITNIKEKE